MYWFTETKVVLVLKEYVTVQKVFIWSYSGFISELQELIKDAF